jgi:hypothetical protein
MSKPKTGALIMVGKSIAMALASVHSAIGMITIFACRILGPDASGDTIYTPHRESWLAGLEEVTMARSGMNSSQEMVSATLV